VSIEYSALGCGILNLEVSLYQMDLPSKYSSKNWERSYWSVLLKSLPGLKSGLPTGHLGDVFSDASIYIRYRKNEVLIKEALHGGREK
jgi:hypothetical protein